MSWRAQQQPAELQMLPVQGNVYLLAGAGGNIVVQIGAQGTLVVDTGLADRSDAVLAAIRKLTPKPIQYIINTNVDADHTGGNDALRKAGATYTGANVTANLTDVKLGAQIFAHDNVLLRMSAPTGKQVSHAVWRMAHLDVRERPQADVLQWRTDRDHPSARGPYGWR